MPTKYDKNSTIKYKLKNKKMYTVSLKNRENLILNVVTFKKWEGNYSFFILEHKDKKTTYVRIDSIDYITED